MSEQATDIDPRLATIAAELATMEIDVTSGRRPSETITPPTRRPSLLDDLLSKLESDVAGRFEVERTLGEGGMGVVHLAEQVALGRKVAIKTLRPGVEGAAPVQKVLQEAWITGYLEHPNVVPVYDIARGDDGRPVIVLKRIEGDSLDVLLEDPQRVVVEHGVEDTFEWALRVTIQLCQALAHAHQRGIVHRDIKAENVMVGSHGEVYLLDWGIAVATEDDGTGRFPLVQDATAVAGTPCYMAPEMLGGPEPRLGPWTDVYLVGALLFEICTGRPPHEGTTLMAIIQSVLRSPPAVPDDVPEEMRAILDRAMDSDPEGRFENVDQLRLALEAFLEHRGSRQLAEKADVAAAEMDQATATGDVDAAEVAFTEARFGYRAALELWSENPEAKRGLRQVTEQAVRAALERHDAEAAGRMLAAADDVDPALEREVAIARKAAADKRAALAAMEEDLDIDRGRRTRAFLTLVLSTVWVVAPVIGGLLDTVAHPRRLFLFTFGVVVLTVALFAWARESMTATRINRTLSFGLLGTMVAQMVLTLAGWQLELSSSTIRTLWMVIYLTAVLWGMASVTATLWPSALAYALAAAGASLYPQHISLFMAGSNCALMINLLVVNRAGSIVREGVERHRQRRSRRPGPRSGSAE